MTRVNVYFTAPEPLHDVDLNEESQAAWDRWETNDDPARADSLWDDFLWVFETQMDSYMGHGAIEEVYEEHE